MLKKAIPQHKRLAQGGGHVALGYAKGGSVGVAVKVGRGSPLTAARRNNGIKGMKDGGKC